MPVTEMYWSVFVSARQKASHRLFYSENCLHVHVGSEVENWNTILWSSAFRKLFIQLAVLFCSFVLKNENLFSALNDESLGKSNQRVETPPNVRLIHRTEANASTNIVNPLGSSYEADENQPFDCLREFQHIKHHLWQVDFRSRLPGTLLFMAPVVRLYQLT